MSLLIFIGAAALLALERVFYVWVWHRTEAFQSLARQGPLARIESPVDVLRLFFYGFKVIQGAVFLAWWLYFGDGSIGLSDSPSVWLAAATALAVGQALNLAVFWRIGYAGVFYGNRLGHDIPWQTGFPFSVIAHPQYVGTVLTIWGLFLLVRFPEPDWLVIPVLETLYYALGARYESDREA